MHLFGGQIGPEGVRELQKLAENEQFDYNSSEPSKEPVLVECSRNNGAFAFQPFYPPGLCHAEQEEREGEVEGLEEKRRPHGRSTSGGVPQGSGEWSRRVRGGTDCVRKSGSLWPNRTRQRPKSDGSSERRGASENSNNSVRMSSLTTTAPRRQRSRCAERTPLVGSDNWLICFGESAHIRSRGAASGAGA